MLLKESRQIRAAEGGMHLAINMLAVIVGIAPVVGSGGGASSTAAGGCGLRRGLSLNADKRVWKRRGREGKGGSALVLRLQRNRGKERPPI